MNLLEKLTAAFTEADAKSIAAIPEDVKANREWYGKLVSQLLDEHNGYSREFYNELNTIASKQTQQDNEHGFEAHVDRETKRTVRDHAERNLRIAKKFQKCGIEDIDSTQLEIIYGENFSGSWLIDGHYVKLDVIWAGGYNIQCLHCRVTCKVNKREAA